MDTIEDLLKRLSEGKLSAEEKALLFEWIRENRHQWASSLYDEYRRLIEHDEQFLSEDESRRLLRRIHQSIGERAGAGLPPVEDHAFPAGRNRVIKFFLRLSAAASVLIAISLAWFYFFRPAPTAPAGHQATVAARPAEKEVFNDGAQVLPVELPDGSSVLLYPASRITFSASFDEKREARLSGKAFFEIVRDPGRPFRVYANEMVTKVLGTSFLINAFDDRDLFSIVVKTGKVAVTAAPRNAPADPAPGEVNLTANEQISFDRNTRKFIRPELLPAPDAEIVVPPLPETYRFRDTPVTEILDILEKDYSIEIKVDADVLSGCSLTTTLKEKPLFEKLKVICEAIGPGTTFTMNNGRVVITTLGCNH